jgi:hypothetical protein
LAPPHSASDHPLNTGADVALVPYEPTETDLPVDSEDPFEISLIYGPEIATEPEVETESEVVEGVNSFTAPIDEAALPPEERKYFTFFALFLLLFTFFSLAGGFAYFLSSNKGVEGLGDVAENLVTPDDDVMPDDTLPPTDLDTPNLGPIPVDTVPTDYSVPKDDADKALEMLAGGQSPPLDQLEDLLASLSGASDPKSLNARFRLVSELAKHYPKYSLDLGAFYDPTMPVMPPSYVQKDPFIAWDKYKEAQSYDLPLADKRLSDLKDWAKSREADAFPDINDFRTKLG